MVISWREVLQEVFKSGGSSVSDHPLAELLHCRELLNETQLLFFCVNFQFIDQDLFRIIINTVYLFF